ncbi:hypothetical protein [Rosistilla oblonga]|uniref:hypothetical protein n=1 Tax=Rosistilla oblonga TaxID=2527990 RepID=UPI003A97D91B
MSERESSLIGNPGSHDPFGDRNKASDEIERWVVERYGPIESEHVDMPQFYGCAIVAAAVPLLRGVQIGMGPSRQLAIHDLYLRLTTNPELETSLPPWWQKRVEGSR